MGIELLAGDGAAIRSAAGDIASTIPDLRTAHRAATQVESVLTGDHWQGTAFDAFRRVVERKPLPQALDVAVDRMGQAAEKLQWFAGRFEDNQARLRHLRAQEAAVADGGHDDLDPVEAAAAAARLRTLEAEAQAVHDEHRACLDAVAELFDWLDDQPIFATPPPSNWDRLTGAVGDAAGSAWDVASSFGAGVYEGFRDLVLGIRDLLMAIHPGSWPDLWANRAQIAAMLRYVAENPLEFLGDLGTALVDLDTLFSDPARWLGRRVPDLLLALGTAGAGTVTARAAGAARVMRGSLGHLDDASRVMTGAQRLRATDALTRTDAVLGRLADRADSLGAVVRAGRQAPGELVDDIQAFTGQLGRVDALLVGASAMSVRTRATTNTVAWLDAKAGTLGTVDAVIDSATPPPCR